MSAALLRATQIRLEMGKITPVQAANTFDGLRYRWRGDSTELETIRALGQLYLGQGRYREALEALRSAGAKLPDLPGSALWQPQSDLAAAFRALFLDGNADGLEPIQALGLFYDFKELTPVGAEGDQMVRNLSRRLVDVDLLDQAAELLKYQADSRLDGVLFLRPGRHRPGRHLPDGQEARSRRSPCDQQLAHHRAAQRAERRAPPDRGPRLGRRGQVRRRPGDPGQGQLQRGRRPARRDHLENSAICGQGRPAVRKAALLRRWKQIAALLSADEEGKLACAAPPRHRLAGDDPPALARPTAEGAANLDAARQPRSAARPAQPGVLQPSLASTDFSRVSADNEAFTGWVAKMKARFKTAPVPVIPAGRGRCLPPWPRRARQTSAGRDPERQGVEAV